MTEVLPQPIEPAIGESSPVRPGDLRVVGARRADDLLLVVLAGDARGVREAEDLVRAFIGPSYASAKDPRRVLVPGADLTEHVNRMGGEVARVLAVPPAAEAGAVAAVTRMLAIRARRPAASATRARPLASVLRDVEAAIARGDVAGGRAFPARGREHRSADACSTGASWRSASSRWSRTPSAVLAYARSHRLADLAVPAAVQEAVLGAYASVHLLPKVAEGAAAVLQEHEQAGGPFAAYFVDHRRATSTRIAARLGSALRPAYVRARRRPSRRCSTPRRSRNARCSKQFSLRASRPAGRRNPGRTSPRPSVPPARTRPPGRRSRDGPAEAPSDDRQRRSAPQRPWVTRSAATKARAVGRSRVSATGGRGCWPSTSGRTKAMPSESCETAVPAGTPKLNHTEDALDDLPEVIEALAGEQVLDPALPLLNEAFADSGVNPDLRRRRKPVDLALAYVLPSVTDPGLTDVEVLVEVAGRLLESGLSAERYIGLVEGIERLHERLAAPAALGQAIADAIDHFVHGAAPSREDRENAVRRLAALLLVDARRGRPLIPSEVYAQVFEILEEHAEYQDLLAPVRQAAESGDADDRLADLAGKSILLHTLIEAAAVRAKAYVEQRVICQVSLDASSVGNDVLRTAAANADVVVVAWRAAKHSAYETLKDAAQPGALRYARGKGWSSLVAALRQ